MKYLLLSIFVVLIFSLESFSQTLIREHKTFIKIEEGKCITKKWVQIEVHKDGRKDFSKIQIPFTPKQEIKSIEATLSNLQGEGFKKLSKRDLETFDYYNHSGVYDTQYKEFSLISPSYPYLLTYSYEVIEDVNGEICSWLPSWYLYSVSKATLQISVLDTSNIIIRNTNCSISLNEKNPNSEVLTWNLTDLEPNKNEEIYAYPEKEIGVRIMSKLATINGNSVYSSWENLGDWILSLTNGKDLLPDDLKKKVHVMTDSCTSQLSKAAVLFNYLKENTRYMNIAIGEGGLVPESAEKVAIRKYGDCKGLSVLMKGMLFEAGIESNYVLISAGRGNELDIDTNYVYQQFNHIFLAAKINEDTIWIENTAKKFPLGYVGQFRKNRLALWLKKGNSQFVQMPSVSNRQSNHSFHFKKREDDSWKYDYKGQLKNQEFESFLYRNKKEQKEIFIKKMMRIGMNSNDVEWLTSQLEEKEFSLKIATEGEINGFEKKIGPYKVLEVPKIDMESLQQCSDRKSGFFISEGINLQEEFHFEIPEGYHLKKSPDSIVLQTEYGELNVLFKVKGQVVTCYRTFQLFEQNFEKSQCEDFKSFMDDSKQFIEKSKLILSKNE